LNQTYDLLACSAVPEPTAPPRTPIWLSALQLNLTFILYNFDAAYLRAFGLLKLLTSQVSNLICRAIPKNLSKS
jgi:hypothetical protein